MDVVPLIVDTINEKVNEAFYKVQNKLNITDGGLPPEQELRLDSAKEELMEVMLEIIKMQLDASDNTDYNVL